MNPCRSPHLLQISPTRLHPSSSLPNSCPLRFVSRSTYSTHHPTAVANIQYSTEGTIKTPNLLEETQEDLLSAGKSLLTGNTAGMMSSLFGAAKGAFELNQAHEKTKKTKTSSADVVMWSGCKDSQTVSPSSCPLLPSSLFLSYHTSPPPPPDTSAFIQISFLSFSHHSLAGQLPSSLTTERRYPGRRSSNRSDVIRLHLFTQEEP